MREYIIRERELQAGGTLTDAQLAESLRFCADAENDPAEEVEAYDHFLAHLPSDETDDLSLVLRVQLLIEQRVREFLDERMLNPEALEQARLSAHQAICLAEALTFPTDEPRWLWSMVRRLSNIRNDLAHQLRPEGVSAKMAAFAKDYSTRYGVRSEFLNCTAHMYSQLSELARLARSELFRVHGKPDSDGS